MSTGIRVIVPDAFDFTSTMLTGSTVPFAWTLSRMLRRSTGAVSIVTAASAFFLQPTPLNATAVSRASLVRGPGRNSDEVIVAFIGFRELSNHLSLQIAADQSLELSSGNSVIVSRLNERLLCLRERCLRRDQIEQRRRSDVVTLLLHSYIFLSRGD